MQDLVDRYIASFNETDRGRRYAMLAELYASDGTYTDPHVDVRGPDAIDEFIAQTQERFPGAAFSVRGPVDAHHDQARFQWQAGPPEQPDLFIGFDVIVAKEGRIRNVYGFMDAAPAA